MIRQDRSGRKIYSNTLWNKMLSVGQKLTELGYRESRNKPNLFFKKTEHCVFFADLRGTEELPIWDNPRIMFYWKSDDKLPMWKRRRLVREELVRLDIRDCVNDCKWGLTFEIYNEFSSEPLPIDEHNRILDWEDGFCHNCGRDFQDEGWFCSKECELESHLKYLKEEQKRIKCKVCGKHPEIVFKDGEYNLSSFCSKECQLKYLKEQQKQMKCEVCGKHPEIILKNGEYIFRDTFVKHHTNYEKNIKILTCNSCNIKIGKNPQKYPEFLVPKTSRKDFIKKHKKEIEERKRDNKWFRQIQDEGCPSRTRQTMILEQILRKRRDVLKR